MVLTDTDKWWCYSWFSLPHLQNCTQTHSWPNAVTICQKLSSMLFKWGFIWLNLIKTVAVFYLDWRTSPTNHKWQTFIPLEELLVPARKRVTWECTKSLVPTDTVLFCTFIWMQKWLTIYRISITVLLIILLVLHIFSPHTFLTPNNNMIIRCVAILKCWKLKIQGGKWSLLNEHYLYSV